jgi:hypothetical protein
MIGPIFTAKLNYVLELVTDTIKAKTDMGLKRLHTLHWDAMKAALGIQMRDHPENALGVFVRTRNNFIRITDNFGIIQIIIRIIRIMDNFS